MKRVKLLPSDVEKIDLIKPYRLKQEDLDKLKQTIAGFDFYNIGGILVCPTCGQPPKIQSQVVFDGEVYFFLQFFCLHYGSDAVQIGTPIDPSKPA